MPTILIDEHCGTQRMIEKMMVHSARSPRRRTPVDVSHVQAHSL